MPIAIEFSTMFLLAILLVAVAVVMIATFCKTEKEREWNKLYGNTDFENPYRQMKKG